MDREDDLSRENRALRERLSRLSEASLRINESLDCDTVLHEAPDSGRALMKACFGVVTLLDEWLKLMLTGAFSSAMSKVSTVFVCTTPWSCR